MHSFACGTCSTGTFEIPRSQHAVKLWLACTLFLVKIVDPWKTPFPIFFLSSVHHVKVSGPQRECICRVIDFAYAFLVFLLV